MRLVTTGATPKRLSNRGRPGRPDGPQDRAGSFDPKPVQNGNALTRAGVMGFAERACGGRGTHSAQNVLGALRSFLRFAHVTGVIGQELASAVPTAGSVRAGLPRRLDRAEVARLLGSCDRGSRMGRRDFAVLTVLWRLGLRSAETAGLTLEDIDWPVGEVVVRGKGGRCDRLPLPVDGGRPWSATCAGAARAAPAGCCSCGSGLRTSG